MLFSRVIRSVLLASVLAVGVTAHAGDITPDSVAVDSVASMPFYRRGVIGKVYDYFAATNTSEITTRPRFSFIGGPSYSKDTKFGIGLLSAGLYSTDPADSLLMPSNVSIVGQISTAGYYMIGVRGAHIYPHDSRRFVYDVKFSSFRTYFWGIGFDAEHDDDNQSRYNLLNIALKAEYSWRLTHGLYAGPMINMDYSRAHTAQMPELWCGEPMSTISAGAGLSLRYDTRDHHTTPYDGELVELSHLVYPDLFGSRSRFFMATEFSANVYRRVWKGGVVATRLHGEFSFGRPMWNMLPILGGRHGMRGYYDGRYRDRNELDVIVELRQNVWRRSGIVVWGGVGSVFRDFGDMSFDRLLPNIGIGYRWEFKHRTNVRLDYGIGRKESGLVFQINEAF